MKISVFTIILFFLTITVGVYSIYLSTKSANTSANITTWVNDINSYTLKNQDILAKIATYQNVNEIYKLANSDGYTSENNGSVVYINNTNTLSFNMSKM